MLRTGTMDMYCGAVAMIIALVFLMSQSVALPTSTLHAPQRRSQVLSAIANNVPSAPSADSTSGTLFNANPFSPPAMAFIQPVQRSKPPKLSHRAATNRLWLALTIAQHSAASFDAWTTRRKIQSGGYHENNPLLRPFAGNGSLYVAVQTTPVAFDFIGNRMRNSHRRWLRRLWWVPQVMQTGTHLAYGAMNLAQ